MRKALVIGIDYYETLEVLKGCVNDAYNVKAILERHFDGTKNFEVRPLIGAGTTDIVERGELRDAIKELFSGDEEIALLYFAGHGYIDAAGGFLCAGDTKRGDDGLSIADIITFARESAVINKVIILDSCHSGIAAVRPGQGAVAELSEGMTILTASTAEQYAAGTEDGGIFTTLLVDALSGAAGNLTGDITLGSVYAHIDQSLGAWEKQRPIFRTNVKNFVSLRKVSAPIGLDDLRQLVRLFPAAGYEFHLDPTYEPERGPGQGPDVMPAPIAEKNRIFAIFQKYNRVGLLRPEGADHMWHAAMHSKSCKLTVLGEHYRRLVERDRI